MTKTCTWCEVEKPLDDFASHRKGLHGKQAWCRACFAARFQANKSQLLPRMRRAALKRKYGITPEQYEEMHLQQGGLCAICRKPERIKGQRLAVDHCHDGGGVRSLLCKGCNVSLGNMNDDPALLRAAADYIERHKENKK